MSNAPPASTAERTQPRLSRMTILVLAICWATVIADGFDVVVFGAVVPSLLAESSWGLTPGTVGLLGSLALIGMFIGSLVVGTLTDTFGRRKMLIGCVIWFSVFTGLCALAPSVAVFGALRFMAGFALGGVLPTASALTAEYSPTRSRNLVYGIMFSGFPIGGILAALIGIFVIPVAGWRPMFVVGVLPVFLIVPIALKFLPESVSFLIARGRHADAEKLAVKHHLTLEDRDATQDDQGERAANGKLDSLKELVSSRYILATLCFWATSFVCLFMIYGLNTWLPQIMRTAGYSLGSALTFLFVYNLGAIAGLFVISLVADRFGSKPVIVVTFLVAAVAVALLSVRAPTAVLYLLAIVAGAAVLGTQAFINAWVSKHYPVRMGATALGWSLGLGRLGSVLAPTALGLVIASSLSVGWSFYAIAIPGLIGAAVTAFIPRKPQRTT